MSDGGEILFVEWCAADALGGTLLLDPMTELVYRRIIDMIYATNDALLDNDEVMAHATKAGKKWLKIKTALIDEHQKIYVENGRIRNKICTEKLAKAERKIRQKSHAGFVSSENRKSLKNNKTGSTAVPTAVPTNQQPYNQEEEERKNKHQQQLPSPRDPPPDGGIFALGEQIAALTGWKDDPNWTGNYSRLSGWLGVGWSFELDVLPTIRLLMKNRKGQPPPHSLKYFERAIANAFAARTSPLPKGNPNESAQGNSSRVAPLGKHERAKAALRQSAIDLGYAGDERAGQEKTD